MRTLALLFVSVLISSAAFGQRAVIVVQADSSAIGKMCYLERLYLPGTEYLMDYQKVDSARIDSGASAQFKFMPEPSKRYSIWIGHSVLFHSELSLVPGDSLVVRSKDEVVADRIGAIRAYFNAQDRLPAVYNFSQHENLDWYKLSDTTARIAAQVERRASTLRRDYPEHAALADELYGAACSWRFLPLLCSINNYWDSTGKPVVDDPVCIKLLDSIPWDDPILGRSLSIVGILDWWQRDMLMRSRYTNRNLGETSRRQTIFERAMTMHSPARDIAILLALDDLIIHQNPAECLPIAESWLTRYAPVAKDSSWLRAYDAKLSLLRSHLPGHEPPAFSLPDSENHLHSLPEFRGKIVYLDFWGTWCGPCRKELPMLLDLQNKFSGDTSVVFVSVALESIAWERWKEFIHKNKLKGVQLFAQDPLGNRPRIYGLFGVPTFMLIGRDGTFIDAAAPRPSSGKAEAAICDALAKPTNP